MNLVDIGDLLEIFLGGTVAANQLQFDADWIDVTASDFTPGHSDGQTNNTTVVTMVASPAASTYRIVKHLNVYNKDTADVTVTIQFDNGGTNRELVVMKLSPGD